MHPTAEVVLLLVVIFRVIQHQTWLYRALNLKLCQCFTTDDRISNRNPHVLSTGILTTTRHCDWHSQASRSSCDTSAGQRGPLTPT
jgi:hypothetical protein